MYHEIWVYFMLSVLTCILAEGVFMCVLRAYSKYQITRKVSAGNTNIEGVV